MNGHFVRWLGVVPLLLLMPASALGQTDREIEELFWRSVECESAGQVGAYLEVYPEGAYVAEAWACLEEQLGLDRAERRLVQQGLAAVGHDPGPADGLFGGEQTRTRQAIRAGQAAKGMEARGYLTRGQAETLMALGQETAAQQAAARRTAQAEAEQAEAARQAREADDAAYEQAQRLDTAAAYGDYLATYPQGQHANEARAAERQRAARERVVASLNAQMVRIQGGAFRRGCQVGFFRDNDCPSSERPAHRVEVRSFEISRYEVTQEVWEAVMGENRSRFRNCPQCPVERVSWNDVQGFLRKLNTGGGQYRLPSEAEWEYAARGGPQSRGYEYAGNDSLDAVAWYKDNSRRRTHPVGQKQANELGLYDMSGNVSEWVQDCFGSYSGTPRDGRAWESGDCNSRVLRGGSWNDYPEFLRSASRYVETADNRYSSSFGFRMVRSLP